MSKKSTAIPDSDESMRPKHHQEEDIDSDDTLLEGVQTSNKTGKHSSVEKMAASRPEMGTSPTHNPVDGASGETEKPNVEHVHDGATVHRDKALRPK